MGALNKVMVIGNLGRDPEVRMAGPTKVANFSVAVTEKYNDKDGNKKEKTEWINIVLWAKLAEIAEKYLNKGSTVYIEGKLETQSWDDKDGNKKYKTEVRGLSLQMMGSKGDNQQSNHGGNRQESEHNNQMGHQEHQGRSAQPVEDDLPF